MKKVICQIFGHHYSVSKKVTQHIKEYKCIHCDKEVKWIETPIIKPVLVGKFVLLLIFGLS
jgi:hypothetical protein